MTVAQAKARLRAAAERLDPAALVAAHPLASMFAAATAGMAAGQGGLVRALAIKGASWGLRFLVGSLRAKADEE